RKRKPTTANRLPSLYSEMLLKSESDYRTELKRRLDRITSENQNDIRRRLNNDHVFQHELLTKRQQWLITDKSYRDTCRSLWYKNESTNIEDQFTIRNLSSKFGQKLDLNNSSSKTGFLPKINNHYEQYFNENLSVIKEENSDINCALNNEMIKRNFLEKQPVMLEIHFAPHSSKSLRNKQNKEMRKQSAQRKQTEIQKHALTDPRFRKLVSTLEGTKLPPLYGRKRPYTAMYGDIHQPYTAVVLRRNTAVYDCRIR
ncbi:unnamed protein product, partial [Didymodactylos carnosus]